MYWKIFFSFWCVVVLSASIFLSIDFAIFQSPSVIGNIETEKFDLHSFADNAAELLERDGLLALSEWLNKQPAYSVPRVTLAGPDKTIVLSGERPQGMNGPFGSRRPTRMVVTDIASNLPFRDVLAPNNRQYRLIFSPPEQGAARQSVRPGFREIRLLIAVLVSSLICLILARYLTRPILDLREAGRRITAGDLSARAGTAIVKRSDELGELGRDFDQMAEHIESLMTTQQRLLRDVSHELRSPLARLQVAVGLARQQTKGSSAVELLDRADLEIESLNELIGQILSFVRLQSAQGIKRQLTDMDDVLTSIADDAEFEAQTSQSGVVYESSGPCLMQVDSDLIRSAIENIVRNALRYTPEGCNVVIEAYIHGVLHIEISDSGPGVPESDLEHIFEPFYRVDEARNLSSGASGIGLAIAARAIRMHDGTVEARNGFSSGLIVKITLPLS